MYLSEVTNNSFHKNIELSPGKKLDIRFKKYVKNTTGKEIDSLILDVNCNGMSKEISVLGGAGYIARFRC